MFSQSPFGSGAHLMPTPPPMREPRARAKSPTSPTSPTGSLSSFGSLSSLRKRNSEAKKGASVGTSPQKEKASLQAAPATELPDRSNARTPQPTASTSAAVDSGRTPVAPGRRPSQTTSPPRSAAVPSASLNRPAPLPPPSAPPPQPPRMWVRARFDFDASDPSALSFRAGDIIEVLTMLESGWWDGMLGETRGWFPSNFVEEVDPSELDAEDEVSTGPMSLGRNAGRGDVGQGRDGYGLDEAEGVLRMDDVLGSWGEGGVGLDDLAREAMGQEEDYDDFGAPGGGGNDGDEFLIAARQRAERSQRGRGPVVHPDEMDEFGMIPDGGDNLHSRATTGGTVTQANHANRASGTSVEPEDAWIPKLTPDGQLFYHNTYTGEDSWELPLNTPSEDDLYGNDDFFGVPPQHSYHAGSSHTPQTASTATSTAYPSASSDVRPLDNGFRPPPSAQGELPHPWIARLADDGSEWCYLNQQTGETTRQPPRRRPSSDAADSLRKLSINTSAGPRTARLSVELQRKAVADWEKRTKEALTIVLQAREKPTMVSLIEAVGDSLRELFEAAVAGSAAEEEMSRASALGSQAGVEAAIHREDSAEEALALAYTSILSSVRALLLAFGYVGPLDPMEDMPRPAWTKDLSVIGCLGLLSANVHAALESKWTPVPDTSVWPEVMRSATKLKEAIAGFPGGAFPTTAISSLDSIQGKAAEGWLGVEPLGEFMNGRWGFGKDTGRPFDNVVIAEAQKLKEDYESLTAGATTPTLLEVLRVAGKFRDTLHLLDIAAVIDIDFDRHDLTVRHREEDVRVYAELVRRAQASLGDLDNAYTMIANETAAIYSTVSTSTRLPPFEPLGEAIAACVASLITLLAASQEQASFIHRGLIKGFLGRRSPRARHTRPVSMVSAASRRSGASSQSYLDSKRHRVHGIEEEFLDPEDMELERLDPQERMARLAMTGMAGGSQRFSNGTSATPQISPAGSGSQVSISRPTGQPPMSATSSTTSLAYQKTESDGASTKGSNRTSFMRNFMRGRSASDADPGRNKKPVQQSQKLAKILGEDPGRSAFAATVPSPPPNETVWYLADDYYADEIVFDERGGVKAGTLRALVARLTPHGSTDTTFFQAFMLTFRSFTSGDELLDLLFERYDITAPAGLSEIQLADWKKQKQIPIRLRVSNVLRSWLDVHYMEAQDSIILDRVEHFATTVVLANNSETLSKTLTNLVLRRRQGGEEAPRRTIVGSALSPPAPLVPRPMGRELRLTDIDPRELARQLTIIEHANFQRIKPVECLHKAWTEEDEAQAPNVRRVIHTANKLAGWVSLLVLQPQDAKSRATVMKYFITTAMELKALYNFSSMAGVIAGLNAAPVDRLKRTKELLSAKTTSIKEELDKIMDSSKNFSNYKDMLKTINPPCVPFFGFYLSALTFIEDGNKDFIVPGTATSAGGMPNSASSSSLASISAGRPSATGTSGQPPLLVNFFKRSLSAEILRDIQQYQSQPYNLARCRPVYEYLMMGLERVETSGDLYERSLMLEPREREEERITRMLHDSVRQKSAPALDLRFSLF